MRAAVLLLVLACSGQADAFNPAGAVSSAKAAPTRASVKMETEADLRELAEKLNPAVGFWDPLQLAKWDFTDTWEPIRGEEARIGFLRHAEIKHGRVAMAAFVGYCIQANGIHWPWALTGGSFDGSVDGIQFADISAAGSPPEQWDALPTEAKLQILLFIGFLEFVGESSGNLAASGEKHYMKGGKPGFYPSLKAGAYASTGDQERGPIAPHPVPYDLFDPFGLQKDFTPEDKERALLAEINNGRLAMLGIMGFLAEQKVPGSVGLLTGLVKPYAGEVMAPFTASDASLPFVADMLKISPFR